MILGANIIGLAAAAGLFLLLRYFRSKTGMQAAQFQLPLNHPLLLFIDQRDRSLSALLTVMSVFLIGFLNIVALLVSHKIAGPLYRLRCHLDSVAQGKSLSDVRFRDGDLFPELAQSCNEVMKRIRERAAPLE